MNLYLYNNIRKMYMNCRIPSKIFLSNILQLDEKFLLEVWNLFLAIELYEQLIPEIIGKSA